MIYWIDINKHCSWVATANKTVENVWNNYVVKSLLSSSVGDERNTRWKYWHHLLQYRNRRNVKVSRIQSDCWCLRSRIPLIIFIFWLGSNSPLRREIPTYTHKHTGYSYPAIQGKRNYIFFLTSSWNFCLFYMEQKLECKYWMIWKRFIVKLFSSQCSLCIQSLRTFL